MMDSKVHPEKTSKCIYCLQTKPVSDFNREHVISRFMGTYKNAFVLSGNQVCKECNNFFCENLENELSLDSLEAFLRTKNLSKKMSAQRAIGRKRLRITGQNGLFKGLPLFISSDTENSEKIHIALAPSVGFALDEKSDTYEYYTIDTIPECTEETKKRLSTAKSPIVFIGYEKEEVTAALIAKGFDLSKTRYRENISLSELTEEPVIAAQIRCEVDSLLCRLAAKNIFNFICHSYGKEYAMQPCFNNLRAFIRYGTITDAPEMFIDDGEFENLPNSKENGHIVGTSWTVIGQDPTLCGFISWFGAITYTFALCAVPAKTINCVPPNKLVVCDNQNSVMTLQETPVYFDWPGNEMKIVVLDENFCPIADP